MAPVAKQNTYSKNKLAKRYQYQSRLSRPYYFAFSNAARPYHFTLDDEIGVLLCSVTLKLQPFYLLQQEAGIKWSEQ